MKIAGVLGLLALLGVGCWLVFRDSVDEPPPPPRPVSDPADIVEQVHNFCGTTCHAYPPPDTFPRKYWREEVGRGFKFFDRSGLPLKAPPVESVVRYYQERAPEELPEAALKPAS